MSVAPIGNSITSALSSSPSTGKSAGAPFGSVLSDAMKKVDSFQTNANNSVNQFLSGEGEEIHKVALSAEQADLSFQLFMQVRNKVVAAYQEVMRMQI